MNMREALNVAIEAMEIRRLSLEHMANEYHRHGEALPPERTAVRQAARRYDELTAAIAMLKAERDKA
jgi:hypothetical protein